MEWSVWLQGMQLEYMICSGDWGNAGMQCSVDARQKLLFWAASVFKPLFLKGLAMIFAESGKPINHFLYTQENVIPFNERVQIQTLVPCLSLVLCSTMNYAHAFFYINSRCKQARLFGADRCIDCVCLM